MKKLYLLLILVIVTFFARAQNTVTLEAGTSPLTTYQLRYKGITPDSLNHLWIYWNGKYNRIATMTEANLLYAPITGGGYVPNSRQIINGFGVTGGHSLLTDVTLAIDTTHDSSGLLTWNYGLRFLTQAGAVSLYQPLNTKLTSIATLANSAGVLTNDGSGGFSYTTPSTGTVTAVSVVSSNGFAGSSSGGATPALTISTTVTGIIKGNGTALSAAVSNTDYLPVTSPVMVTPTLGVAGATSINLATGTLTTPGTGVNINAGTSAYSGNAFAFRGPSGFTTIFDNTITTNLRALTIPDASGIITLNTNTAVLTNKDLSSATNTFPTNLAAYIQNSTSQQASANFNIDGNGRLNNVIKTTQSITTAAGTTTLTVASPFQTNFTGSTTQTLLLPVTSTLTLNQQFSISNYSSGLVTVQSSGANTITVIYPNKTVVFTCILTSGTTAASWDTNVAATFALASSGAAPLRFGRSDGGGSAYGFYNNNVGTSSNGMSFYDTTNNVKIFGINGGSSAVAFSGAISATTIIGSLLSSTGNIGLNSGSLFYMDAAASTNYYMGKTGTTVQFGSAGNFTFNNPISVTGTATATTFSGAGTSLTGTAASLNIGGSAASLSAASTLPNNTLATTQSAGDNSTKVETTAGTQLNIAALKAAANVWSSTNHFNATWIDGGFGLNFTNGAIGGTLGGNTSGSGYTWTLPSASGTVALTSQLQTTGQTTLTAGVSTITISGLTTSSTAVTGFVAIGGTVGTTWQYKAVCTANTLTITAITTAGATDITDTSTINYSVKP